MDPDGVHVVLPNDNNFTLRLQREGFRKRILKGGPAREHILPGGAVFSQIHG